MNIELADQDRAYLRHLLITEFQKADIRTFCGQMECDQILRILTSLGYVATSEELFCDIKFELKKL